MVLPQGSLKKSRPALLLAPRRRSDERVGQPIQDYEADDGELYDAGGESGLEDLIAQAVDERMGELLAPVHG